MTRQRCVLAVDGGNTKTTAVVADRSGTVIATAQGGCSDIHWVHGPGAACAELDSMIEAALAAANCSESDLEVGVFSLAGCDWPEDHDLLVKHMVASHRFGFDPLIFNDAYGGLRSAAPTWEGIALICGTGNAVAARRRNGVSFHLGFWPDTIGGITFSQAALDAVQRDHLKLGPKTSLTTRALELYDAEDGMDLLHQFTRVGGRTQADMVLMSPVLLDEADLGDPVAHDIVATGGTNLGQQGAMCAGRIGLEVARSPIVMSGGLFRHPSTVLEDAIMAELPGAISARTSRPPVIGALLVAGDLLGESWDADELSKSLDQSADL
jgi:N-acetylglucosamine kinase-like BadF-type ATPase